VAEAALTAAPESIPKSKTSDELSTPPIPENKLPTLDFLIQFFEIIDKAFSAPVVDIDEEDDDEEEDTANEPNAADNSPHKKIQAILAPVGELLRLDCEAFDALVVNVDVVVCIAESFEK
jgi:hypothetical protein